MGDVITFGSDKVAFSDTNGGISVTSIANPTQVTPLPNGISATANPETNVTPQDGQYNPNFTLQVQSKEVGFSSVEQVTKIAPGGRTVTIPCNVPNDDTLTPVGWSHDTHLVVGAPEQQPSR